MDMFSNRQQFTLLYTFFTMFSLVLASLTQRDSLGPGSGTIARPPYPRHIPPSLGAACPCLLALAEVARASGPWQVVEPETQGLSRAQLLKAAGDINREVSGRKCFLAVKNGKIVHEECVADRRFA